MLTRLRVGKLPTEFLHRRGGSGGILKSFLNLEECPKPCAGFGERLGAFLLLPEAQGSRKEGCLPCRGNFAFEDRCASKDAPGTTHGSPETLNFSLK